MNSDVPLLPRPVKTDTAGGPDVATSNLAKGWFRLFTGEASAADALNLT